MFHLKSEWFYAIIKPRKAVGDIKKTTYMILFILAGATFLSLGIECLLNLLGLAMAISLDGPAVTKQYPRWIPFCILLGIVALLGLIVMLILNIKVFEKFRFTKSVWVFESVFAFVLSIPMIKLWEMLFDFLQKTF